MLPLTPHFAEDLRAAGLLGLPFTWSPTDGTCTFDARMTAAQIAAVQAVIAAHDPTDATKQAAYLAVQRGADFDGQRLVKAVAIWAAGKLGVPLATARSEILAIYQGLAS